MGSYSALYEWNLFLLSHVQHASRRRYNECTNFRMHCHCLWKYLENDEKVVHCSIVFFFVWRVAILSLISLGTVATYTMSISCIRFNCNSVGLDSRTGFIKYQVHLYVCYYITSTMLLLICLPRKHKSERVKCDLLWSCHNTRKTELTLVLL